MNSLKQKYGPWALVIGASSQPIQNLERAVHERFTLTFMKSHPLWEEVRKDARFRKLMKKVGLEK